MSIAIPERLADLLSWEKKAIANLALVLKDGAPHVTPIWFDYDGSHIIVNTTRGRVKDRVMRRRPTVALAISDPANLYRYLLIWGAVVGESEEGGYEMICKLNDKYHGKYEYPKRPGEVRVTYKIRPERVYPRQ